GRYVELGPGGQATNTVTLPVSGRYLLLPVFDRQQLPAGSVGTRHALDGVGAGVVDLGWAGPQGATPPPRPRRALRTPLRGGARGVSTSVAPARRSIPPPPFPPWAPSPPPHRRRR